MSYFDDFITKLPGSINRVGTNIQKLAHFITDPMGDVRGLFTKIGDYRSIDNATGAALDALGAKYGQARGPADDEFYRIMIKSKIIVRAGDSTVNGILRAIEGSLSVDADGIEVRSLRSDPAGDGEPLAISVTNIPLDIAMTDWEQQYLLNRIKSVVAAGVRVDSIQFVDSAGFVVKTVVASNSAIIYTNDTPF